MNCRKVEEDIYLYDMLGTDEKKIVDDHISQCINCKELLDHAQQQQEALAKIRSVHFAPEHAAQMTMRIMSAIEPETRSTQPFPKFLNFLSGYAPARYAFAAVSLLLMFSFAYEQTRDIYPHQDTLNEVTTSHAPAYAETIAVKEIPYQKNTLSKRELSSLRTALEAVKTSDHRQLQFVINGLAKKNDSRLQRVYTALVKCLDQCREQKHDDCSSCRLSYYQNIK